MDVQLQDEMMPTKLVDVLVDKRSTKRLVEVTIPLYGHSVDRRATLGTHSATAINILLYIHIGFIIFNLRSTTHVARALTSALLSSSSLSSQTRVYTIRNLLDALDVLGCAITIAAAAGLIHGHCHIR